jgi:hypothetical protein
MWPGDGTVEEGDVVFAAAALKCCTVKFRTIVDQLFCGQKRSD